MITSVKEQFSPVVAWINRFNALSIRERALVCAATLGTTWAIWFYTIDDYLSTARTSAQRDVQITRIETQASDQKKQELMLLAALDPNDSVETEIIAVRADLRLLDIDLQSSLSQFIPPNAMTLVLRDVIADHKNLSLNLLNRLPARELLPEEERTNLYLHPMRLELEGAYLDVLNYIESLESGDWQFNWRSFDYTSKEYPNGVAIIEIETLSKDKHWLGL